MRDGASIELLAYSSLELYVLGDVEIVDSTINDGFYDPSRFAIYHLGTGQVRIRSREEGEAIGAELSSGSSRSWSARSPRGRSIGVRRRSGGAWITWGSIGAAARYESRFGGWLHTLVSGSPDPVHAGPSARGTANDCPLRLHRAAEADLRPVQAIGLLGRPSQGSVGHWRPHARPRAWARIPPRRKH